jgi:hypothetical protein
MDCFPEVRSQNWLAGGGGGFVLAGLLAAGAAGLSAAAAAPGFSKGPYLQAPGADTMTICWESLVDQPAVVRYGAGERLDQTIAAPPPRRLVGVSTRTTSSVFAGKTNTVTRRTTNEFFVYAAALPKLEPDTAYSYAVELGEARSKRRQFRTFGTAREKVSFVAYGDSRSNPNRHARIVRQLARHEPGFILHTGDLVARGRDYALWSTEFFRPLRSVIDHVPVLPALGNHEEDATNYLAYFHLPEPERWYSLDVGPVHLLALDFHFEHATNRQFAFARRDLLASRAPWKIVFLHYPMFNVGGHMTTWGHEAYLPLFHEAGVALVLSGHSHVYERFRPEAPRGSLPDGGITHITTGGGGAPLYPVYDHPALAVRASTNHFVAFEATAERLRGRAVTAAGETLDEFELRKAGSQPMLAPGTGVYPEEALKLWFEVSRQLTARLASRPSRSGPAWVMFTVKPLKASAVSHRLTIGLAADSAPHYRLIGESPVVLTPPASSGDRVVWAQVLASGTKRLTTNSSGELSPPLVFQATVSDGEFDFTSRGARSRVSAIAADALKGPNRPGLR